MNAIETQEPRAQAITINEDSLSVDLMDGRTIIAPLIWYPHDIGSDHGKRLKIKDVC